MTSAMYHAYKLATTGIFVAALPPFWLYTRLSGRYGGHLNERLGLLDPHVGDKLSGFPRIWLHAVSLGEVKAASAIAAALEKIMPQCTLLLSTTTEHGRELAEETFKGRIPIIFAPVDYVGAVRKALRQIRPQVVAFLETEIWPNWLAEARRLGVRTALVNGRISVRSFSAYRKFRRFFCHVLNNVDAFSMILEDDAIRIREMGAPRRKVFVHGNAKFDALPTQTSSHMTKRLRMELNLTSSSPVIVAGSTRTGEESMVLDAYEQILVEFPETILIIAPRHVGRSADIEAMVRRRGFSCQLKSRLFVDDKMRTAPILVLDTFGELFDLYSVSTLVFCGASFVPLGGQNPLEPAIWEKPVFFGPSMEDFEDAKVLLESSGGGFSVQSPRMLAEKAISLFRHPEKLKKCGRQARQAVLKNHGAALRHAQVIAQLAGSR